VAVLSGNGGAYSLSTKIMNQPQRVQPPGRVLVFKLGGTAKLPPNDLVLPPPNPSNESFPTEQVAAGEKLYGGTCRICHGGSVLPDLRRSGALPDEATWNSIVIGGALSSQGMASFARWLKPEEAEAIRAYMNHEAVALRDSGGK
jgi:mono/diheme cytochrome c family protein